MNHIESQWYDAGYKTARKETIEDVLKIINAEYERWQIDTMSRKEQIVLHETCRGIRAAVKELAKEGDNED